MIKKGSIVSYKGEKHKVIKIRHDYMGVSYILQPENGDAFLVGALSITEIKEWKQ